VSTFEQWLLSIVGLIYSRLGWPGVVILMAIESACIPFPSEIIMPLAGWMLIKENSSPLVQVLAAGGYGALGNTIGSAIAYGVGMWGGRPFLEKYGKYLLIHHDDLDTAEKWFNKTGSWSIFASRLLPVIRTFISLPAGIARMNFPKFLFYTFIGSFLWSTGLVFGGYQLGEHWEQLRAAMRPFDPVIGVLILALLAFYIYRHVKKLKS
jgi:membrane protein DedA with SNARE-associated domain